MEYKELLDRARGAASKPASERGRYEFPRAQIFVEGNKTIITNFKAIADALRREPSHILKFLSRELGAAGNVSGQRATFYTRLEREFVQARVEKYTKQYVLCNECGKPDTHIEREGRCYVLRCEACGAHRPVKPV